MNIIDFTRTAVEQFALTDSLHIDYTERSDGSCGLSPTGDVLIKEDVLGNQTSEHNFILYTVWQSQSDYDRAANSGLLLRLQYYLEKQASEQHFDGVTVKKITCSNGMLYAVPDGNLNAGVIYQLQIKVQYEKESEAE